MNWVPGTRGRIAIVLALVTAVVFAPGIAGDFVYDDVSLIVRNEFVRDVDHLPELLTSHFWATSSTREADIVRAVYTHLWRPWVSLAYAVQFQAFGESPLGYHVVSLLVHLACVLMAFAFVRRRLPGDRQAWWAAGLGAALFALHPTRPETVTWISGSTDLWMTFWVLLSVSALTRRHWLARAAGGLCMALAVWSKEAAIVVPVLLLFDAWAVHGRRPRLGIEGVAVAGGLVALISRWVVGPGASGIAPTWDGAVPRVLSSLGHFVARTAWPWPPAMEPAPRVLDASGAELFQPWSVALGALVALAAVAVLVAALRRERFRPWAADAAWFLLLLAPVLNLVDLLSMSLVSDRFLYAPLLGAAALTARATFLALRRGGAARRWASTALVLALVAYLAVSVVRVTQFLDEEALWTAELAGNPDALEGLSEMGRLATNEGDYDRARGLFARGLEAARRAGQYEAAASFALKLATLAVMGTPDADEEAHERILAFTERLEREPRMVLRLPDAQLDMGLPEATWREILGDVAFRLLRANALAHNGRLADAEDELVRATELPTASSQVWRLLAATRARRGDFEGAERAAREAIERSPGQPRLVEDLRLLERARGVAERPAPDEVSRAVRDAQVQMLLGWPRGARRILEQATSAHPGAPALVVERARVEAADRRPDVARRLLEEARARDPEHAARYDAALRELGAPR